MSRLTNTSAGKDARREVARIIIIIIVIIIIIL